jgi:hypothetical protein
VPQRFEGGRIGRGPCLHRPRGQRERSGCHLHPLRKQRAERRRVELAQADEARDARMRIPLHQRDAHAAFDEGRQFGEQVGQDRLVVEIVLEPEHHFVLVDRAGEHLVGAGQGLERARKVVGVFVGQEPGTHRTRDGALDRQPGALAQRVRPAELEAGHAGLVELLEDVLAAADVEHAGT